MTIDVRDGEREYSCNSVHEINSRKNTEKFAKDYVKDFYGKASEIDCDTYYFFNCEIACHVSRVEEITKEQYDVLKQFI